MDFSKLIVGQRYLFENKMNGAIEYFRATYLGVNIFNKYTTLVVTNYRRETSSGFIPDNPHNICFITYAKYITNAFTLVDIMENENTKLPDDILFEINKFY